MVKIIENFKVGVRAQDIQTGLKEISSGVIEWYLRKTRRVGMAVRLALNLKGPQHYVIKDFQKLVMMAGELGIGYEALRPTLRVLEEVEFCRVIGRGEAITKVEVSVPELRDSYSELGQYWKNSKPDEFEQTTIRLLDSLVVAPLSKKEAEKSFDLSKKETDLTIEIGKQAGYLDTYIGANNEEIIYSPLYWEENPEKSIEILSKFDNKQLRDIFKKVYEYQGFPLAKLKDLIISPAILCGILPSPSVESSGGEQRFLFTPYPGIDMVSKQILDNARAILSCVRYGQHFASITKIDRPAAILKKLLDPPDYCIGSHSEIKRQYSILVLKGVGFIEPDRQRPGRYFFRLNPTAENIKAVELAIDLLTMGEPLTGKGIDEEARKLIFQTGQYTPPIGSRIRYKRGLQGMKAQSEVIKSINELMRGVSSDLI